MSSDTESNVNQVDNEMDGKFKFEVTRIVRRLDSLRDCSDDEKCLSRFIGTKAHENARKKLKLWMELAGMDVSIDNVGNIRGIIQSRTENAKHFVVGSHYDSVFDAGKYDGPLGILLGIELADLARRTETLLPFHLNILAFSDEEGGRFNTTYFGSSALAGTFDKEWLNIKDDNGIKVSTVLEDNGFDVTNINRDSIMEKDWLGYFEPHIEQGPVLCEENLPVCLVTSIAAQRRINVKWTGANGHAGTCPMNLRNDALCAAAELVLFVEEKGRKNVNEVVATVGKLTVEPNSSNVIPGTVHHSIDLRSPNNCFLENLTKEIQTKSSEISERKHVTCDWEVMQSNPATVCNAKLSKVLGSSIKNKIGRLISIPSGAGHDAVMISKVAPVTMLFIRCKDGISHNPKEYSSSEDIRQALIVSYDFLKRLKEKYKMLL